MKTLDLTAIKDYPSLLAEMHRVSELPRWVHISILADYARIRFEKSFEDLVADVPLDMKADSLRTWTRALALWKQASAATRTRCRKAIYYVEAGASTKYKSGEWNATRAVEHQRNRRKERSFRQYLYNLQAMATVIEDGKAPVPEMLTPEHAAELLDALKKIAQFLVKVSKQKAA